MDKIDSLTPKMELLKIRIDGRKLDEVRKITLVSCEQTGSAF